MGQIQTTANCSLGPRGRAHLFHLYFPHKRFSKRWNSTLARKKRITVDGKPVQLSNHQEYNQYLHRKRVECLEDTDGAEMGGFESLDDGGTYRLGPPVQPRHEPIRRQPNELLSVDSLVRRTEEMVESMLLKHGILETKQRPKRTLSYVTKSHAFSSLIVKKRMSFQADFFFDLVDPVETSAFRSDGPDPSEDESHHCYFWKEMTTLLESAVQAGRAIHQQLQWSQSGHWLKLDDGISTGVEPDFCTTDCTHGESLVPSYERPKLPQSKYDVTIAFAQKKEFLDSDQMDIIDYGERLLCIQRGRRRAYTALFHCARGEKVIRWAETTEVDGQFVSKVTKPASLLPGCEGQRQLLTMLSKSSRELGRDFPTFDEPVNGKLLKVLCFVGEEATAKVYSASWGGDNGVIKIFKDGLQHIADHEKAVSDRLVESKVAGILKCTKVSNGVLFFDQLLRPFLGTLSVGNVASILDFLKTVHTAGVFHRDIRPENIMQDANGNLYLIDWGFALLAQDADGYEIHPFAGTFRYGSEAAVSAALEERMYHYSSRDDLESFVKTVMAVNSGGHRISMGISTIRQGDFAAAREFWRDIRQRLPSHFNNMFDAALNDNYETLKGVLVF